MYKNYQKTNSKAEDGPATSTQRKPEKQHNKGPWETDVGGKAARNLEEEEKMRESVPQGANKRKITKGSQRGEDKSGESIVGSQ